MYENRIASKEPKKRSDNHHYVCAVSWCTVVFNSIEALRRHEVTHSETDYSMESISTIPIGLDAVGAEDLLDACNAGLGGKRPRAHTLSDDGSWAGNLDDDGDDQSLLFEDREDGSTTRARRMHRCEVPGCKRTFTQVPLVVICIRLCYA